MNVKLMTELPFKHLANILRDNDLGLRHLAPRDSSSVFALGHRIIVWDP